jgi:hypothetical protein
MRHGMQCVLGVLRGQLESREITENEWLAALSLAADEQVLPLFLSRLEQSSTRLPATVQTLVEDSRRDAVIAGFLWKSELKGLLHEFGKAQIPVIPLKGPGLAQHAYGGVALRPSKDLDLLVQPDKFACAEALLARLGFVRYGRTGAYHTRWLRGTVKVELHFDVSDPLEFDFDTPGAWRRARQESFAGEPSWRMATEDELLYLCLHGVRHLFERLSYIVDIALAAQYFAEEVGPELYLRPQVKYLATIAQLGRAMAQRFNPAVPPVFLVASTVKQQKSMELLADELWEKLLGHAVAESGGWSVLRFYLRMEIRPFHKAAKQISHLWILTTRMTDSDFAFAASLGFERSWQARLLRPLRIFFTYKKRRSQITNPPNM